MRKFHQLRRLVLGLSGADEEILEYVPSERTRFESLGWAILFHVLNDIGFANVLPVGLALYTRASPKQITGLMIGIYYLHLFAGNLFTGWLAGQLDRMPATAFWLMHTGLMAVAAAILLLVKAMFGRSLAPGIDLAPVAAAAE